MPLPADRSSKESNKFQGTQGADSPRWLARNGQSVLLFAGLLFLYAAALLPAFRVPLNQPVVLPPLEFSHNIPYLLLLHAVHKVFGLDSVTLAVTNAGLMLLCSLMVFRMGS